MSKKKKAIIALTFVALFFVFMAFFGIYSLAFGQFRTFSPNPVLPPQPQYPAPTPYPVTVVGGLVVNGGYVTLGGPFYYTCIDTLFSCGVSASLNDSILFGWNNNDNGFEALWLDKDSRLEARLTGNGGVTLGQFNNYLGVALTGSSGQQLLDVNGDQLLVGLADSSGNQWDQIPVSVINPATGTQAASITNFHATQTITGNVTTQNPVTTTFNSVAQPVSLTNPATGTQAVSEVFAANPVTTPLANISSQMNNLMSKTPIAALVSDPTNPGTGAAVTTAKPNGASIAGAVVRPYPYSDGTNTAPTMDAVGRAGFQEITDGTNIQQVFATTASGALAATFTGVMPVFSMMGVSNSVSTCTALSASTSNTDTIATSTNADSLKSASYIRIFNGTNFSRGYEVRGRANATDGLGAFLTGDTWATQGPITETATGIQTTFTPQLAYKNITCQVNGIGGSGAVTVILLRSADSGTHWINAVTMTGTGATNEDGFITNSYDLSWAVTVLAIGASTTISTNIIAGR